MNSKKEIKYKYFVELYKNNKVIVKIDKLKASKLIESNKADKKYRRAHYFWIYISFILVFILPVILLFKLWFFSFISIILGWQIYQAAKKSAVEFVLENILTDEEFLKFVVSKNAVVLLNESNVNIRVV